MKRANLIQEIVAHFQQLKAQGCAAYFQPLKAQKYFSPAHFYVPAVRNGGPKQTAGISNITNM